MKSCKRAIFNDLPPQKEHHMTQDSLMTNCPATGSVNPYPSHAGQWRKFHGATAWLFNPWTGRRRNASDVGSDPFGMAISVESEPLYSASGVLGAGAISMADCGNHIAAQQQHERDR